MMQQDGTAQAADKAFCPGLWGSQEETKQEREEKEDRMRVYERRAAAGLPLFGNRRDQ